MSLPLSRLSRAVSSEAGVPAGDATAGGAQDGRTQGRRPRAVRPPVRFDSDEGVGKRMSRQHSATAADALCSKGGMPVDSRVAALVDGELCRMGSTSSCQTLETLLDHPSNADCTESAATATQQTALKRKRPSDAASCQLDCSGGAKRRAAPRAAHGQQHCRMRGEAAHAALPPEADHDHAFSDALPMMAGALNLLLLKFQSKMPSNNADRFLAVLAAKLQ